MGFGKRVLRNGFKSVRKSGEENFMKTEVNLRAFQKEDTEAIEAIIREAWHYDDLCSHKTACKLARVFLSSCLANQTYTRVAEIDGKPAGIIMAKNIEEHHAPLRYRIRQWRAILSVMLSKEGRKVSGIFGGVNDIDKALLAEAQTQYQGEVAFFAVSSSVRGKGVGKMLYRKMLDYMRAHSIEKFFLFTDTSCNYGFYEHQGMQRRCEKQKTFEIDGKKVEMTFFLYDAATDLQAI